MLVCWVVHNWEVERVLPDGNSFVDSESDRTVVVFRYILTRPVNTHFNVVPFVVSNSTSLRFDITTQFLMLKLKICSAHTKVRAVLDLSITWVTSRVDGSGFQWSNPRVHIVVERKRQTGHGHVA